MCLVAAAPCTCSDMQLAHVGCDCAAEQNVPATCPDCGAFVRTAAGCGCVARLAAFESHEEARERAYWDSVIEAERAAEQVAYGDPREDYAEWALAAARYQ